MDGKLPKLFVAHFRGHAVSCETAEGAVAIIRANRVFGGREVSRRKIWNAFRRYCQNTTAFASPSRLRQANRLRAVEYLLQLTGFELPTS
jgi:hypothetical protein